MSSSTYYAQVIEGEPPPVGKSPNLTRDWREWREVRPADVATFPAMVLHKYLRERGGLQGGERIKLTVYWFSGDVERRPDGSPVGCCANVFAVSREEVPQTAETV